MSLGFLLPRGTRATRLDFLKITLIRAVNIATADPETLPHATSHMPVAPVKNLSKASVKFLAALGPHAKLPAEMSIFPTLGAPPRRKCQSLRLCLGLYYLPLVSKTGRGPSRCPPQLAYFRGNFRKGRSPNTSLFPKEFPERWA